MPRQRMHDRERSSGPACTARLYYQCRSFGCSAPEAAENSTCDKWAHTVSAQCIQQLKWHWQPGRWIAHL